MRNFVEPWTTVSTKQLFKNDKFTVVEDVVILPNGKETTYTYTPSVLDSIIIIAINEHQELLIQREYSHPPRQILWQLPGGSILANEDIIVAAKRELSEESGYSFRDAKNIGFYYTNNRNSNKRQHVIIASDIYENRLPSDDDEFIESQWLSLNKVKNMIKNNEITNINMLAALSLWFQNKSNM